MVIEYAQLRGTTDGMDTTVITEIRDYYEKELGYNIPQMTPFVGSKFNCTQAGIHADGLFKDEEIYNIFNTKKILKRPVSVTINAYSGLAGLAYWVNSYYGLTEKQRTEKSHPGIAALKEWVDRQYADGRVTALGDDELEGAMKCVAPDMYESLC